MTEAVATEPRTLDDITDLLDRAEGQTLVLTGAGISTESGIPDYRGPDGERRVTPMQYSEFVGSGTARQRYWARSYVGWQRFHLARPNPGHEAVARLQRSGHVGQVITQNVDGLHQAAGSSADLVLELHGTLHVARCLDCGHETPMLEQDSHFKHLHENPTYIRPDDWRAVDALRRACSATWVNITVRPNGVGSAATRTP